ncbi:MAG TPA: LdpA C-terminal domain-containing domain, partial [Candidatus Caenarcaniphilales bacterium]
GVEDIQLKVRGLPWLMASLNDGADPHFRKAAFNPVACPPACPQPCTAICPTEAIVFNRRGDGFSGVVDQCCYGCGRCLPICPVQHISTYSQQSTPDRIAPFILEDQLDALEIHTQVGRLSEFQNLWQAIAPYRHRLKLLAISCPDGEGLIDYLWDLYDLLSPLSCPLIWQTDGRPMSGDIGDGTTRATLKLGQKVLQAGLPGYVQLAGGTNGHTVTKLRKIGLLRHPATSDTFSYEPPLPSFVAGIAYGSFARALLLPILEQVDQRAAAYNSYCLEAMPELLEQAVSLAQSLVFQLKQSVVWQPSKVNL